MARFGMRNRKHRKTIIRQGISRQQPIALGEKTQAKKRGKLRFLAMNDSTGYMVFNDVTGFLVVIEED